MTVQVSMVTPAEALLLMHVHDPTNKEAFEHARITGEVERNKTEERERLRDKYPMQGKLIDELFPGRTAADIPERFDELIDVPLQLAVEAKREKIVQATHAEVSDAPPDAGKVFAVPVPKTKVKPITKEQSRKLFGSRRHDMARPATVQLNKASGRSGYVAVTRVNHVWLRMPYPD
jgi:hypothetical protein